MGQMFGHRTLAVLRAFYRVFLNQYPLKAAVLKGLDELISNFRMIRHRHLRGRKTSNTAQRLHSKNCSEMMLPGAHVAPEILHRSGRGDSVSPGATQPFNGGAVTSVASNTLQIVDHIVK